MSAVVGGVWKDQSAPEQVASLKDHSGVFSTFIPKNHI